MKKLLWALLIITTFGHASDKKTSSSNFCSRLYTYLTIINTLPPVATFDPSVLHSDVWQIVEDYSAYNPHIPKIMSPLETSGPYIKGDIAWAPDGKTFAAAGANIRIWNATTLPKEHTLKLPAQLPARFPELIKSIAYSPNGQHIVSEDRKGHVRIWNIQNAKCVSTWQTDVEKKYHRAIFNKDGTHILSSDKNALNLRDIKTQQPCITWRTGGCSSDLLWLSDTVFVAVTSQSYHTKVLLFDTRDQKKPIKDLGFHSASCRTHQIVCTSDANTLLWPSFVRGHATISLCNLKMDDICEPIFTEVESHSISLHSDDRTILLNHYSPLDPLPHALYDDTENALQTYDKESKKQLETISDKGFLLAAWSPIDTSVLATRCGSNELFHFQQKSLLESLK